MGYKERPAGKTTEGEQDCGVTEERFPCIGGCCDKLVGLMGTVLKPRCPQCRIWTSLPDGNSLKVAAIIECGLYGYGKRMID